MSKRLRPRTELASPNEGFSSLTVLAIIPVIANFYVLLILPFLSEDGGTRIENLLFWPAIAGATFVLVFKNRSQLNRGFLFSLPIVSLAAYLLFAASSIGWAFNHDYAFSRFVVQAFAIVVIVLPYALPIRTTYTIPSLLVGYGIALSISAYYVLTTKATPLGHAGYFTHKQELGLLCATGLILSFHGLMVRGWYRIFALAVGGLALWVLFESNSKSALAFSFIAIAAAGLVLLLSKLTRATPAYILAAVAVASLFVDDPIGRISYRLYGDPTMTGRTEIWEFIGYQIARKPWFGWGFHSYWLVPNSPHNEAWGFVKDMPSSHSGFLELRLETGKIGYWIFVTFVLSSLHGLERIRRKDPVHAWLLLSIAIFAILINLIDSVWLVLNQLWFLYLIVVAETVRYSQSSRLTSVSTEKKFTIQRRPRARQLSATRI